MMQEPYKCQWNNHWVFRDNMGKFLRSENFSDMKILLKDGSFSCHKVVLAAVSPYFEDLLISNTSDSISFEDVTKEEMNPILEYIYVGCVVIDRKEIDKFLQLAARLKIRGVTEEVPDKSVSSSNDVVALSPVLTSHSKRPSVIQENKIAGGKRSLLSEIWSSDEDLVELPKSTTGNCSKLSLSQVERSPVLSSRPKRQSVIRSTRIAEKNSNLKCKLPTSEPRLTRPSEDEYDSLSKRNKFFNRSLHSRPRQPFLDLIPNAVTID